MPSARDLAAEDGAAVGFGGVLGVDGVDGVGGVGGVGVLAGVDVAHDVTSQVPRALRIPPALTARII